MMLKRLPLIFKVLVLLLITIPISKADIEAKMVELPTAEEEATQQETEKASGKQKLKDLGLSDAEIKALTGA